MSFNSINSIFLTTHQPGHRCQVHHLHDLHDPVLNERHLACPCHFDMVPYHRPFRRCPAHDSRSDAPVWWLFPFARQVAQLFQLVGCFVLCQVRVCRHFSQRARWPGHFMQGQRIHQAGRWFAQVPHHLGPPDNQLVGS